MTSWCLPAFAKINLCLRVLHQRADGYHDIETLFVQIDRADQLVFEEHRKTGLVISCSDPAIPTDRSNLCHRAYELMAERLGTRPGLSLHLKKCIPAGAGLGGGSSNAAVTLMALNKLWQLKLSSTELESMALVLGSDVPFFLTGGLCWGAGRGEILRPVEGVPRFVALVVTPRIFVSTAAAYKRLNLILTKNEQSSILLDLSGKLGEVGSISFSCRNDLEQSVIPQHPELTEIKRRLIACGAYCASMSGSGSAVFGLFDSKQKAVAGRLQLASLYDSFIAHPTKWGFDEMEASYVSAISG